MISGLPILNNFQINKGYFTYILNNPGKLTLNLTKTQGKISDIGFFLTQKLPQGFGGALYYTVPPYKNMQYLGAIANERPRFNLFFLLIVLVK